MKLATFAHNSYLKTLIATGEGSVKVIGYHKSMNLVLCECETTGVLMRDLAHNNAIKFVGSYEWTGNKKYQWIKHSQLGLNSKWQETRNTLSPEERKYLIEVLEL